MSRIGRQPVSIPQGVKVQHRRRRGPRRGPEGQADAAGPGGTQREAREQPARDLAERRRPEDAGAARSGAGAGGEHGDGREGRLRAQARDRGHRLPRSAPGQGDPAGAGLLAPGDLPAARGRHGGDRSPGVHHPARRRQGRSSARRRRSCARCGSPTPTRARASGTPNEVVRRKVGKKAGAGAK